MEKKPRKGNTVSYQLWANPGMLADSPAKLLYEGEGVIEEKDTRFYRVKRAGSKERDYISVYDSTIKVLEK